MSHWLPVILATGCASLASCGGSDASQTVAEGVIFRVSFRSEEGKTEGLTRANNSNAVPGGNGSWNIDAYGKLTHDYLFITRPQQKNLGPLVIPVSQLVSVQFGDGGITTVDENRPK